MMGEVLRPAIYSRLWCKNLLCRILLCPLLIHFLLLLLTSSPNSVDAASQRIAEHPQNTTARINDTVILKCRVEEQVGESPFNRGRFVKFKGESNRGPPPFIPKENIDRH
jgi:hypothetical protein